jgi:hypothetical protein
MTDALFEILEVDPEHATRRADFFEHYAASLREATVDDQAPGLAPDPDRWRTDACVATALRFAAQYAVLVDAGRGIALLRDAAATYLDLGVPYGYLLLAAADPEEARSRMLEKRVREHDRAPRPLAAAASAHPAQLTYTMVVMSGDRMLAKELRRDRARLHDRLTAHSTAPVGPQSLPVSRYLTVCDALLTLSADRNVMVTDATPSGAIVSALTQMGRAYADGIERARVNRYAWDRQQAPVDILDLDIVGMTLVANRAMADAGIELEDELGRVDPSGPTLSTVPIHAALALDPGHTEERPDVEQ